MSSMLTLSSPRKTGLPYSLPSLHTQLRTSNSQESVNCVKAIDSIEVVEDAPTKAARVKVRETCNCSNRNGVLTVILRWGLRLRVQSCGVSA